MGNTMCVHATYNGTKLIENKLLDGKLFYVQHMTFGYESILNIIMFLVKSVTKPHMEEWTGENSNSILLGTLFYIERQNLENY
jgi:hypothetical protein